MQCQSISLHKTNILPSNISFNLCNHDTIQNCYTLTIDFIIDNVIFLLWNIKLLAAKIPKIYGIIKRKLVL